jgi:hypothetical protein
VILILKKERVGDASLPVYSKRFFVDVAVCGLFALGFTPLAKSSARGKVNSVVVLLLGREESRIQYLRWRMERRIA